MRAGLDPGSAATEASIGPRPPLVGPEKAKRFRPEIEGLRAVAALLVAAYHVWFGTVSGGVDVFFVVAGFMMTVTIVGHYERYGRLRIVVYLGRLMTRLLPNALVVLATVGLATVLFLPATQWKDVFAEIAASAAYVENWTLIDQSVDYLQRDDAVSPV
ncbi:MAG: acyltransferase, partial [Ornithinimicrobium sp.]